MNKTGRLRQTSIWSKTYDATSLGIGLTSNCNLHCPHCYAKHLTKDSLSVGQIRRLSKVFPKLKKVNFGTGESILNPELPAIIEYYTSAGIGIALTSNGATIRGLSDNDLKKINEVDISLDYPDRLKHDRWRGQPGVFDSAIQAIERCKELGVEVSIVSVLMNHNYTYLKDFRSLLDRYGICLRVNIYKPVDTDAYSLSYDEFWEAMAIISEHFTLVSSSEPILSLVAPETTDTQGSPCGDSLRLHPDLSISPCVFMSGHVMSVNKFASLKKMIPDFCRNCARVERCRGGCLSRRILEKRVDKPDSLCPIYRGQPVPKISFNKVKMKEYIHSGYLCTLIIK